MRSGPPVRGVRHGPWRAAQLAVAARPFLGGLLLAALSLAACGAAPSSGGTVSPAGERVVAVAAAENVWGSIARQVGGVHAQVTSIITNPNTDPHSYDPTAAAARTLADAQLVIENGVGYDPWVPKLLGADGTHPVVLDVGTLVGVATGGNPHRWYDPGDVRRVVDRITTDLEHLDPADAAYFARQRSWYVGVALKPYDDTIAAVKEKYAGTPVGASESIFAMIAPALGLDLVTPRSFLEAISEGTDVSAGDTQTIDRQIRDHLIKVYVYNSQNVTPDVQAQLALVQAEHIPYARITETLVPAGATYQAWQTRQLLGLEAALARAAAR